MNDQDASTQRSPRVPVAELAAGQRLRSIFLVLQKRNDVTRSGDPYLSLTVGDKTGSLQARVWEQADRYGPLFEAGDFVFVDAFAETYRGDLQLRIAHLERVDPSVVDEGDFVAASAYDPDEMLGRLRVLLDEVVEDAGLARLLGAMLGEAEIEDGLRRAPAAKVNHHAYLAGLLELTLRLFELARQVGRHYERQYPGLLRTELLVAGALLHDLGKVWELTSGRTIEYTDVGNLVGHITIGVERLNAAVAATGLEDTELILRLKHMILSHHGEPEFGAVVKPKTPEAQVLHYLDQIDARLNMFAGALDGLEGGWTSWVSPLRRTVYAGPTPEAPPRPEPAADPAPAPVQTGQPPSVTGASQAVPPREPRAPAAHPAWADYDGPLDDDASPSDPEPDLPAPAPPAVPAFPAPPRGRRNAGPPPRPPLPSGFDLEPAVPEPVTPVVGGAAAKSADEDETGPLIDSFTLDLFVR